MPRNNRAIPDERGGGNALGGNALGGDAGGTSSLNAATTTYVQARITPGEYTIIPSMVDVNMPPAVFAEMRNAVQRQLERATAAAYSFENPSQTVDNLRHALHLLRGISLAHGAPVRLTVQPDAPPPPTQPSPMVVTERYVSMTDDNRAMIVDSNPNTMVWTIPEPASRLVPPRNRRDGRPTQAYHSEGQEPEDL